MRQLWTAVATYMGLRSRFFDQYLQAACQQAGIRQIVLLAAGLDTRAHRLTWPDEVTVFEIDHPNVVAFKDHVLSQQPGSRVDRRPVGVDLRDDWPAALRQAGFDPNEPTVWLAEGLLVYLPDAATHLLCRRVHTLSATGSQCAIESIAHPGAALREHGVLRRVATQFGVDPSQLWPPDQRWDPHPWLLQQGWAVTAAAAYTVAARYQRVLEGPAPIGQQDHPSVLLTATAEHPTHPAAGPAGTPRSRT